jgi:hypothetical protein
MGGDLEGADGKCKPNLPNFTFEVIRLKMGYLDTEKF